jgi:phage tail protein X
MNAHYRTRSGDVLDAICWRHYGRESALVAVLEANLGLASFGPHLPAGLLITLPALAAPPSAAAATIRLWD